MKVVIAFDKFKGSATTQQLNETARQALQTIDGLDVVCIPIADGGDGTTAVLASQSQGQWVTMPTMGPIMQMDPVQAQYFLCEDGTALIDVAAASGLALLPDDRRDVMMASTFGTGLLMRDAMERGSRHIVLGLGGSATCDAAMGILTALGAEFLDADGRHLFPNGASLECIARIEVSGIPNTVRECRFTLLADVTTPLCGKQGSARVFAPQKGANAQQVEQLERGLEHVREIVGNDIADQAGAGAAGGIPSLMMHLLDARLLPGAPYVFAHNGMERALDGADLVITGEGRLDTQTLMGKAPGRVIDMARERGIPVTVVCGIMDDGMDPGAAGIARVEAVSNGLPHEEAMDTGGTLMRVTTAVQTLVKDFIR